MSLAFDAEKVLLNVRGAETADLLDRVTVYRAGMEPEAAAIAERELYRRGMTPGQVAEHADRCRRECLFGPGGLALACSYCRRPAVANGWGWQRLFRVLPVIPRRVRFCSEHRPRSTV